MAKEGCDVTIFGSGATFENVEVHLEKRIKYIKDAFNFDPFSKKSLQKISYGTSAGFIGLLDFKRIRNMLNHHDFFYFVYPSFLSARLMRRLDEKIKAKVILGNNGTFYEILLSLRSIPARLAERLLRKEIFNGINRGIFVHTLNDFQRQYYLSLGFNNVQVIPQSDVYFKDYRIANSDVGEFNIVFLNKLTWNKGVDLLLDIITLTP